MYWDMIVLTASNKRQGAFYEAQLKKLIKSKSIDDTVKYRVVVDDNEKRIGSGGATLSVIYKLKKDFEINDKKILLIHSGGDSKRVPQYSVCGKLFSPVLKVMDNGLASNLFVEILKSVEPLIDKISNGIFILCGDALLSYDSSKIESNVADAVIYTVKAPEKQGVNHGVVVKNSNGYVATYLQKPSIEIMKSYGAVNSENKVDIDTGAIFFGNRVIDALSTLFDEYDDFVNDKVTLNLYTDFLMPMAKIDAYDEYISQKGENGYSEDLKKCRKKLWDLLRKNYSFKAVSLPKGKFIHFGTTKELVQMIDEIDKYDFLGWQKNVLSNIKGDFVTYNSYIEDEKNIFGYVENSIIGKNVTLPKTSIVSGAKISDVDVPDDSVLSVIGLKGNKYCLRLYKTDLNTKEPAIWNSKMHPVINSLDDCSKVLNLMINNSSELDKYEKISFADCSKTAKLRDDLEKEITALRRSYYLSNIRCDCPKNKINIKKDKTVCTLPLRVNLAGGWTDTPPYSNDFGGSVINCAIQINNEFPVYCSVEKIEKPVLDFYSVDLNSECEIDNFNEFSSFSMDENDFFIHKSSLLACGIFTDENSFNNYFEKYGGLKIVTSVNNIPKGSGLGTSSILCAAAAKAVCDYFGIEKNDYEIIDIVLRMEQIMGTGGGWQDQIGGLIPGIKRTTASPGKHQIFNIEKYVLTKEFVQELEKRYVLIFSGKQRLAKNILKKTMDNVYEYSDAFCAINEIKKITSQMDLAIKNQDVDLIGTLLNEHWVQSKKLCSTTTNNEIEKLLNVIEPYCQGMFICGAGGGGFLQIMLKKQYSVNHLREVLYKTGKKYTVYPIKIHMED